MKLDPEERAAPMRLLIEGLDAEVEEGVEDAWRVEIERRMAERDSGAVQPVPWEELGRDFTGAEWLRLPLSSTLRQRRRPNLPMTGTSPETLGRPRAFAKSYGTRLTLSRKIRIPGLAMTPALVVTSSLDFPSA